LGPHDTCTPTNAFEMSSNGVTFTWTNHGNVTTNDGDMEECVTCWGCSSLVGTWFIIVKVRGSIPYIL
jgi:hypothetical protein